MMTNIEGKWYIKNIKAKPPPLKRRILSKEDKKEDDIKDILRNENGGWNGWIFKCIGIIYNGLIQRCAIRSFFLNNIITVLY